MIKKALLFAQRVHGNQVRKDGTPYISHPVEVAIELARNGADENLICAGLLHDTIEDAHVTKSQLEESFNRDIADLVAEDSEDKTKTWEERKCASLQQLYRPGDCRHKMLMCADRLSNLRSLYQFLQKNGETAWTVFNRGRAQQAWLYTETVKALSSLSGLPMYEELRKLTNLVFDKESIDSRGTEK